jgi:hypothetical protein
MLDTHTSHEHVYRLRRAITENSMEQ